MTLNYQSRFDTNAVVRFTDYAINSGVTVTVLSGSTWTII